MQILKQLTNAGISGWSRSKNHTGLFAVAQTKPDESNNNALELAILSFDSSQESYDPIKIGSTYLEVAAQSISWSTFGEDTNRFPYGLICIGHVDGSMTIYDVNLIIQTYKVNPSQPTYANGKVSDFKEFQVPVYTVEFNSYKPNLIAIGGDEVLVVDISKDIENPIIIAPSETNLHEGGIITSVSWNKKVPHILASASSNGVAVVWNLKTNQVSFQLPDMYRPSGTDEQRQLSVAWNPEIPLQFAINYHDENKPELHIWDLRETRGPISVLDRAHTRRVEFLSWCSADPTYILTAGADQKAVCWNIKTKEVQSQFVFEQQIIALNWSEIPSLFSVVLADGTVQIYSIAVKTLAAYPPKWYAPIVGAAFAPNNTLTSFSEKTGQELTRRTFSLQDENHTDYVRWFQELNTLFEDDDLIGFCDLKAKNLHSDDTFEQDQWRLLKAVAVGTTKEILNSVGYSKAEIVKHAEDYTGKKHVSLSDDEDEITNAKAQQKASKPKKQHKKSVEFTVINEEQADDFFSALTISHTQNNQSHALATQAAAAIPVINGSQKQKYPGEEERTITETVSRNSNWNTGAERNIKDNLIVGNFEGAIDCAMKCGRVTEALLIAFTQDASLFTSTAHSYFLTQTDDNYVKQIFQILQRSNKNNAGAAADANSSSLLDGFSSLKNWRESAGLAITSAKNVQEFQLIMNHLGSRYLEEKSDDNSAICCFILGNNFSGLVEIYMKSIDALKHNNAKLRSYYMLQSAMKLVFLTKINESKSIGKIPTAKFDAFLIELAKIALANSLVVVAYRILSEANPKSLKVATMMDLLFNTHTELLEPIFARPPVPYKITRIQVSIAKNTNTINQKSTITSNTHLDATAAPDYKNTFQHNTNNNRQTRNLNATNNSNLIQTNQNDRRQINRAPIFNQDQISPPPVNLNLVHDNSVPLRPDHQQNLANNNGRQINNNNANKLTGFTPPINNNLQKSNNVNNTIVPPPIPPVNNQGGQKQAVVPSPITRNNEVQQDTRQNNPWTKPNNNKTSNLLDAPPLAVDQGAALAYKNPTQLGNRTNNIVPAPPLNNDNTLGMGVSNVRGGPPPPNPNAKALNEQLGAKTIVPPRPVIGQQQKHQLANNQVNQPPIQHQEHLPPQEQITRQTSQGGQQQKNTFVPPPPVINQPSKTGFSDSRGGQQAMTGGNSRPPVVNNNNAPPPIVPPPIQNQQQQAGQNRSGVNASYSPSQDELNLIGGVINNNLGIFEQVDPKKKDDHINQMNHLLQLLQTSQLKVDQVKNLYEIAQSILSGDQKKALNCYTNLSKIDFSTHKHWLSSLKRIIAQK